MRNSNTIISSDVTIMVIKDNENEVKQDTIVSSEK